MATAQLGFEIDSSQAKKAAVDLDGLTDSAGKADKATGDLGKGARGVSSAIAALSDVLAKIERNTASSASGIARLAVQTVTAATAAEKATAAIGTTTGAADALAVSTTKADKATASLGGTAENTAKKERDLATATKEMGAATAVLATEEKAATIAVNDNVQAVHGHASASKLGSAQTMALFHSIRSMSESMLLGVSPTQALTAQLNHLSFVLSGPGGVRGAIAGIGELAMKGVRFLAPIAPAAAAVGVEVLGLDSALEKATGKSVSFGQIFSGVLTMIEEGISSRFKPAIDSVGGIWQDAWSGVASFAVDQFNIMTRNAVQFIDQVKFAATTVATYWNAAGKAAAASWSSLPSVMGDITIRTAQGVISGVQSMINSASGLINKFIGMVNGALAKVPGIGSSLQIGTIGKVDFGQLANPYKGQAANLSDQLSAISGAANKQVGAAYDAMNSDIAKSNATNYFKDLTTQIKKEQAAADAAGKSTGKAAKHATDPWKGLRKAVDQTNDSMKAINGASKDIFKGIIDGFRKGESASQIFGEALNKLADKMENSLLDKLFPTKGDTTTGLFGSLFGGGGGGLFGGLGTLLGFDGGGYTGAGARSGGMDGKGGFLAMLHPQETVVDHTKQPGSSQSFAPAVASQQQQAVAVQTHVTVSVDDDGKVKAYVEKSSAKMGVQARQAAVGDVKSGLPGWQQQLQTHGAIT